jgi:hypothetical protein
LEDTVLNGKIEFERIFKREDRAFSGLLWHRIGTGGWSCCECGKERSDSIKCEELLDWLRKCQLLQQQYVIT